MENKEIAKNILNDFKAELNFDNWLENIGKFPKNREKVYSFNCKKIETLQEAKKWISNDELWEGVQRASSNYLFNLFQSQTGKGEMVDEFGQCIANFFHTHQALIKNKIKEKKLKVDDTYIALYSITLEAFIEFSINKVSKNININLNLELLKLINEGYLPCGWQFYQPKLITEYSNIPFDYSSGCLYIY